MVSPTGRPKDPRDCDYCKAGPSVPLVPKHCSFCHEHGHVFGNHCPVCFELECENPRRCSVELNNYEEGFKLQKERIHNDLHRLPKGGGL